MTDLRDAMGNPWWVAMYNRYNFHDPSNVHYGHFPASGINQPMVIGGDRNISVQLSRHCNGVCSYDIGNVTPNRYGKQINDCSDNTGAPFVCSRVYLGEKSVIQGSPFYDRIG